MARKKKTGTPAVDDYRHDSARRKNNPPAKLAAEGTVPAVPKATYSYTPRLPPVLRFDADGKADVLPELLREATRRPSLTTRRGCWPRRSGSTSPGWSGPASASGPASVSIRSPCTSTSA